MKLNFSGLSSQSEAGERKPLGNDDDEGLCPSLILVLLLLLPSGPQALTVTFMTRLNGCYFSFIPRGYVTQLTFLKINSFTANFAVRPPVTFCNSRFCRVNDFFSPQAVIKHPLLHGEIRTHPSNLSPLPSLTEDWVTLSCASEDVLSSLFGPVPHSPGGNLTILLRTTSILASQSLHTLVPHVLSSRRFRPTSRGLRPRWMIMTGLGPGRDRSNRVGDDDIDDDGGLGP